MTCMRQRRVWKWLRAVWDSVCLGSSCFQFLIVFTLDVFFHFFLFVYVWEYVWRVSLINHKTVSQSFSESCSEAVLRGVAMSVSGTVAQSLLHRAWVSHSLKYTRSNWAWASSPGLWYITKKTSSKCHTHLQHLSIIYHQSWHTVSPIYC